MLEQAPQVGFGLWKVPKDEAADVVVEAIRAGYRHFDSAADYGNEKQVGEGIARAIDDGLVTREELWITSKLWNTFHAPEHVELGYRKTLNDLGLDRLDLYLIHFPIALEFTPIDQRYPPDWIYDPDAENPQMRRAKVPLQETWRAMEALVEKGLVRQIGVANYNTALLHDLMNYSTIEPSMLQVELHPYLPQERLLRLAREVYGIPVTAYSPFGGNSYVEMGKAEETESPLSEAAVRAAAEAHGKSTAQVVLRWGVQRGTHVIPKSTDPEHMRDNLDVLDWSLSDAEMDAITGLKRGRRFNDPGSFTQSDFNSFHPIYE